MINVIGLGYIGLPTALMLASHGMDIIGTDYNRELVKELNAGDVKFKEKGMNSLFLEARTAGIRFCHNYQSADMYIISVPTPYDSASKKIDVSYIKAAVKNVLEVCRKGVTIVIESTVSPGTIDKHIIPLVKKSGFVMGKDINLAHAPERIIPGNMIYELIHNNRTIGADDKHIGKMVMEVYSQFCEGEIVVTDIRTAEMTKVVENTFRDINIAYANELAKICRSDNMDVYEIIRIANKHPRVNILSPGPGVGGHCISVDPWFLVGDYPGLANIILAARKINDSMPEFVLLRISEIMKDNDMKDITKVGLYGLTYKENVDDIRESPTMQILESMDRHLSGNLIKVYDPFVTNNIAANQYHNFKEFLDNIHFIVIMVGHDELINSEKLLEGKIILDTRNVCNIEGTYHL